MNDKQQLFGEVDNLEEYLRETQKLFKNYQEELMKTAAQRATETWQNASGPRNIPSPSSFLRIPARLISMALTLSQIFIYWPGAYSPAPADNEIINMYSSDGVHWASSDCDDR